MFSFDGIFFGEKKIAFALLFPKCIDDLLSINHSQSDENFVSRLFLFFFNTLIVIKDASIVNREV